MSERTTVRLATIALASSLLVAAITLTAASWTGATVMMVVAVGAVVASCHQGILIKSAWKADDHGGTETSPEPLFRSYVVAILLYALGAGVALSESTAALTNARPVVSPLLAVLALALAIGIAGAALVITLALLHTGNPGAIGEATPPKTPPVSALLIEHAGAIASLLIAALSVAILSLFGINEADGAASICVGLVLAMISAAMCLEVRKAMRGEPQGARKPEGGGEQDLSRTLRAPHPANSSPAHEPSIANPPLHEVHLSRKERKRLKRHS